MKKKLLCLLLVLIMPMCALLAGCKDSISSGIQSEFIVGDLNFIKVKNGECFSIFVCKETKVMYLVNTEYYRFGMTAILNPDGTPMLWEGEL